MDDVDGVVGAERLRQDVVHARALQHGTHGTTGDNTGTRRRRLQEHDAGGLLALDRVRDGALDTGDLEEVLLGLLHTLGDGGRHLLGLAVADTDGAVRVAHHDQRGEAEAATTLDYLGDTVDRDDALDVRGLLGSGSSAVTALPVPPLATGTATAALGSSHWITSLFSASYAAT
ncbi:putative 30S ribosomal protein S5 [Streptomyces sp. Tu6071]|nr:putative 30S ribosomal protein S5 [Streptomyces sp. Tu6071]